MASNKEQIAIVGLGYVGLPLAAEFGNIRPTLGFDIDQSRVAELRSSHDSTLEVSEEQRNCLLQIAFTCVLNKSTTLMAWRP
jgi:UDP-N-acetyl-D-galactosamine dehydrogenase